MRLLLFIAAIVLFVLAALLVALDLGGSKDIELVFVYSGLAAFTAGHIIE
jgi:hypothetical protein